MKTYFRKLVALVLAVVLCSQTVILCSAYAYSDQQILGVSNVSVSMIANALANDPAATDIQISQNVLTYKMGGTTDVRIAEMVDNNGIHCFDIVEGNIHNTLSISAAENRVTLDGVTLDIEIIQSNAYIPAGDMLTANTVWVYSGTRNVNIVAEDAIRNLAVNTLLTLMLSAMGGIGVTLSLAQVVYTAYQQLTSNTVYATRTTYFEEHYWAYKYIDKYYSNSSRTNLIDSVTTEHWE